MDSVTTLSHTATNCNTLLHTATHCNTTATQLQHKFSSIHSGRMDSRFKKSFHVLKCHIFNTHCNTRRNKTFFFFDRYCSTVQGLLDWFEVDLGFTELSFIQIDLCVLCVFVLHSRVSLSSCPLLDILHCLPRAVGVPLESALVMNHSNEISHCGIL